MSRITLLGASFIVLSLFGFQIDDDESLGMGLKSQEAKNAIKDYEKAIDQANATFEEESNAARKELLSHLEAAQQSATKENDLDEALLIRNLREELAQDQAKPEKRQNLRIISAFYGQNISWHDVTDKVRRAVGGASKWSTTVNTKDWGEPAPGFKGPRTLLVQYSIGGRIKHKSVYEGKEFSLP